MLMIGITLLLLFCMPVFALSTSDDYTYGTDGKSMAAPASYVANQVYDGTDLGVGSFSQPSDLYVDRAQTVYIADSGNNRIVILDRDFRPVKIVKTVNLDGRSEELNNPQGVFKAPDGLLYICDTGNARVIAIDDKQNVVRKMTNEELTVVNKNFEFKPEKVVVDDVGNVYVVDPAIYQGIVQYDDSDRFLGFFAPNEVQVTADVVFLQFWKGLFNSEQRESMEKALPSPYNNLYIDTENFIYTSSATAETGNELKRLNAMGVNILQTPGRTFGNGGFGDLEISYENYQKITSSFIDVHADNTGIICGADAMRNRLFQYDQSGNLISIFGGKGNRKGMFLGLKAVDMLGDCYLALDAVKETITVFKPTEYMEQVQQALVYYNQGQYVESVELWQDILQRNCNFVIAYRSIGRAYLQQGYSQKAMQMLKRGDDKYFYSLALKEYRKEFIRSHFLIILIIAAVTVTVLALAVKRIRMRRRIRLEKGGA
jgi:hypothetical protein